MAKEQVTTEVISIDAVRTAALAELNPIAAGIAAMTTKFENVVYDVSTPKGMKEATAARLEIREVRYKVPHIVKERRAQLRDVTNDLQAEGDRIVAALLALETPIDQQITAEQTRKAEEKAREQKRVADLRTRIAAINATPGHNTGKTAAEIEAALTEMREASVPQDFAEFQAEAATAHANAIAKLETMLDERKKYEADQAELAAFRAREAEARRVADEAARTEQARTQAAEIVERAKATPAASVPFEQQIAESDGGITIHKTAQQRGNRHVPLTNTIAGETLKQTQERVTDTYDKAGYPSLGRLVAEDLANGIEQVDAMLAAPAAEATTAERPSSQEIIAAVASHFLVDDETAALWIMEIQMDM